MDKREKLEMIDKILQKLNELENSEVTVLKKIVEIDAANIDSSLKQLNAPLHNFRKKTDMCLYDISHLINKLQLYRKRFTETNKSRDKQ